MLKSNFTSTEEDIRFGCSLKYLKIRIKEEWILFQRKLPIFLLHIFALGYFYPVLMRNVGFYLHHTMQDYVHVNGTITQKSLYDLGHQVKQYTNIYCIGVSSKQRIHLDFNFAVLSGPFTRHSHQQCLP